MDFDKILSQWETQQKQSAKNKKTLQGPGKKANAPSLAEKKDKGAEPPRAAAKTGKAGNIDKAAPPDAAAYMNRWLAIHGAPDKDKDAAPGENDRSARIEEAERLKRLRPQAFLDLHGKTASEAETLIGAFLVSARRSGLEKVLIIHGKGLHSAGAPVMTELVRKALEANSLAGSFGPAEKQQGGRGATWVRIRNKDYFSR